MRRLTIERLGIALFCVVLIGTGVLTAGTNIKSIISTTRSSMQKGYESSGFGGLITGGISGLETGVNDQIYGRTSYINLYGLSAKMLGKHYLIETSATNSVVKDNHDWLQFICFPVDTTPYVEKIATLKEALDEMNTPLLYVQTPVKVIDGYTEMPEGIVDASNSNTDTFLTALEAKGIDTLDLRQSIKEDKLDFEKLFYTTDHHWTTQTAFWAVGKVAEYLESTREMKLDPEDIYTNEDHYESVLYAKSFLGSQGRRVGKYYGGVDDYTLMLPAFETDYKVTINKTNNSTVAEGTFSDALVKYNLLRTEDIFTNRYAAYFGADFPEVIIENNSSDNPMKVLILKDSFGLPFSAFFSTMVGETRMLDTRYYTGDVVDYVKEYEPDLVLYVYKSINTQA